MTWRERSTVFSRGIQGGARRLGTYLLSVVAVIFAPLIPLFIEFLMSNEIKNDSLLVTTAVLCVGYFVSAEHNMSRSIYIVIFIVTLVIDVVSVSRHEPTQMDRFAIYMLLSTLVLHALERFWWHVIHDRPFPDGLRSDGGG